MNNESCMTCKYCKPLKNQRHDYYCPKKELHPNKYLGYCNDYHKIQKQDKAEKSKTKQVKKIK